jgi:hypothetical protein
MAHGICDEKAGSKTAKSIEENDMINFEKQK